MKFYYQYTKNDEAKNLATTFFVPKKHFSVQTLAKNVLKTQKYPTFFPRNWLKKSRFIFKNYSYYYDWLKQNESILDRCQANKSLRFEISSKAFIVHKSEQVRRFSFKKIKKIDYQFKRLMFPLLLGGILSPLSALATFNNLLDFWLGTGIMIISFLLFYQGWQGGYQVVLFFSGYQISFFTEEPTKEMNDFFKNAQKLLKK